MRVGLGTAIPLNEFVPSLVKSDSNIPRGRRRAGRETRSKRDTFARKSSRFALISHVSTPRYPRVFYNIRLLNQVNNYHVQDLHLLKKVF